MEAVEISDYGDVSGVVDCGPPSGVAAGAAALAKWAIPTKTAALSAIDKMLIGVQIERDSTAVFIHCFAERACDVKELRSEINIRL